MPILDFLRNEWATILQAPATFITGWVLFSLAAYSIARAQFSERLSTLNERLNLANDRAAISESELKILATKYAECVKNLNNNVVPPAERAISEDQLKLIRNIISSQPNKVYIVWDMMATDISALVSQIKRVFRSSGWEVGEAQELGGEWSPIGLSVDYNPDDAESAGAAVLITRALNLAKVVFMTNQSRLPGVQIRISSILE